MFYKHISFGTENNSDMRAPHDSVCRTGSVFWGGFATFLLLVCALHFFSQKMAILLSHKSKAKRFLTCTVQKSAAFWLFSVWDTDCPKYKTAVGSHYWLVRSDGSTSALKSQHCHCPPQSSDTRFMSSRANQWCDSISSAMSGFICHTAVMHFFLKK